MIERAKDLWFIAFCLKILEKYRIWLIFLIMLASCVPNSQIALQGEEAITQDIFSALVSESVLEMPAALETPAEIHTDLNESIADSSQESFVEEQPNDLAEWAADSSQENLTETLSDDLAEWIAESHEENFEEDQPDLIDEAFDSLHETIVETQPDLAEWAAESPQESLVESQPDLTEWVAKPPQENLVESQPELIDWTTEPPQENLVETQPELIDWTTEPPQENLVESQPDLSDGTVESSPETLAMVQPIRIDGSESSFPERPDIASIPERPVIPPIPEYLLGQGLTLEESLSDFLLFNNPEAMDFIEELAKIYVEEAAVEGINHDIAFAQMCLETGFLRFGGLVTPEMNNFCGLGAIGPGQEGEWFPDPRTGVRAHIQHLKAYDTDEPPLLELVDPRYFLVRYGSSPKISGLAGTWARDMLYSDKINNILERLYEFNFRRKDTIFEQEAQL